jgi:hypothetical protein
MTGGYGTLPCGRTNCGSVGSSYEPRFNNSVPVDGTVGVSIYQTVIRFGIYSFSNRVDPDSVYVEISENAGTSFSDAYLNGAFVAPYNGASSRVDDHLANSHVFECIIHKTAEWTDDQEIIVRITATDYQGQAITKEAVVRW